MSFFRSIAKGAKRYKLNEAVSVLANAGGVSRLSDAGVLVSPQTSMRLSTVNTCVKILAETLGSITCTLMQKTDGGRTRREAVDHPHYHLVRGTVNRDFVAAKTFFETGQGHLGHRGNAYAQIFWHENGEVELFPMHPDFTVLRRDPRDQRLVYEYTASDEYERFKTGPRFLPAENVLHVKGFSPNGLIGYDPLSLQRESIGLGVALRKFGSQYFAKGTALTGYLSYPKALKEDEIDRIDKEWKATNTGINNVLGVPILHGGVEFKPVEIRSDNAQFIETMGFNRAEIASFHQIPLPMLGDQSPQSYNSLEQFDLSFRIYGMLHWYRAWEVELDAKLLTPLERAQGYYFRFKVDGLQRADLKTRQEYYAKGRQWGWLSANDCRRFEDLPPIEDGDHYLQPLNMVPAGASPAQIRSLYGFAQGPEEKRDRLMLPAVPATGNRFERRRSQREAHQVAIRDAAGRLVRREVKAVRDLIRRELRRGDAASLRNSIAQFYRDFPEMFREILLPALLAYAASVRASVSEELDQAGEFDLDEYMDRYVDQRARAHRGSSQAQLETLIAERTEDLEAALDERLDQWEERRPDKLTRHEVIQAGEAVAATTYFASGISLLAWRTFGEGCPLCDEMDGRTVGVAESFLDAGSKVDPKDGETAPLEAKRSVFTPPLHDGCDCFVEPA